MDDLKINLPTKEELEESKYNNVCIGDKILYDMCHDYPHHRDEDEIHAKLWLIGRSYSAALERNSKKVEINTEAIYENTIKLLITEGNEFDNMIQQLTPIVDYTTMTEALNVHKKLVEHFFKVTSQVKRSLASKYLHFHRRDVFFIFDSTTNIGLNHNVTGHVKSNGEYDTEYYNFCVKVFALKEKIKEEYNQELNPREMDNLLKYLYRKKEKQAIKTFP